MPISQSSSLIISALSLTPALFSYAQAELFAPSVVLANQYRDDIYVNEYWMSEKLDGIRAVWNGEQLVSRGGHVIHAPVWFTKELPAFSVEGELWAGRDRFSDVQRTVLDQVPDEEAWKNIQFILFDTPEHRGDYQTRYQVLMDFVTSIDSSVIGVVEQKSIPGKKALLDYLEWIEARKGEGVMLRKIESKYRSGRTDDLLKLKSVEDTEAVVIGYKEGKGKFHGKMGALFVQLNNGQKMYIGSGFTNHERENPPNIGAVITIKYSGYTSTGLPRFARFHRIRRPE